MEVNQYRLNGPGNGGHRSQMKIGAAAGGTTAAYVGISDKEDLLIMTSSSSTTKGLTA